MCDDFQSNFLRNAKNKDGHYKLIVPVLFDICRTLPIAFTMTHLQNTLGAEMPISDHIGADYRMVLEEVDYRSVNSQDVLLRKKKTNLTVEPANMDRYWLVGVHFSLLTNLGSKLPHNLQ